MKIKINIILILIFHGIVNSNTNAQPYTASSNMVAQPIPDRSVDFYVNDEGVSLPIIWGMDGGGWVDANFWKSFINFAGIENLQLTRIPAPAFGQLVNNQLTQTQKDEIDWRLDVAAVAGQSLQVMLNPGGADDNDLWYRQDWSRYALLMKLTKDYVESFGHTVVSITGYNEPDVWYAPATMQDDYNLFESCKISGYFDGIRYCGGNTLNPDFAYDWYSFCIPAGANEGNTHQLAGTFDSYASFYQQVKANGHYATNDEVHNIMESIVGAEYGMQAGIFWADAKLARGEFVKACNGERLGYAEHRPNWTAAAVYRQTNDKVQAFAGGSERQAITTTFRYFSKEMPVFFDGQGPQHEFILELPGGTGYQENQPYAEKVINISWGDDVQPLIDGKYKIVNRNSGKLMEVAYGSTAAGANVQQGSNSGAAYQQWNVIPINSRIGGDFSYITLTSVHSGKALDLNNYSLNNSANIQVWDAAFGTNQRWYLDYAGDGWFFIRSGQSALCIEVAGASTEDGANIQQFERRGGTAQQWRFLPVDAPVEFVAPSVPGDLTARTNAESILLEWSASPEEDVAGYTIFRSETAGGPYNTIARNVTSTSFLDNSATIGIPYYYVIKAIDKSLNSSDYSLEVSAASTNNHSIIAYYPFEGNMNDSSINLNHSDSQGNVSFVEGKAGDQSLAFNGTDVFVQMPSSIANQEEITITAWVFWQGGAPRQRIFDFGNGESEYMFLTTSSGLVGGKLRFAIKNGGEEETLNASILPFNEWSHLAITLNGNEARMYVNSELADESDAFTISPVDFKPALNYIGRSQFLQDPLFKGYIDDFGMYNYALSADEIAEVYSSGVLIPTGLNNISEHQSNLTVWPVPADEILNINYSPENTGISNLSLFDINGRLVINKEIIPGVVEEINISKLPKGLYMLKLKNKEELVVKKVIID